MEHVLEIGRLDPASDVPAVTARTGDLGATIRAVAAGDEEAFARLHAGYVRMVHAILLGRVPRRDVDDLVQDVFITVFTRLKSLREPAAFGGWLATIARNRATDHLRQTRDQVDLPEDLPGGDAIEAETFAVLDIARPLRDAYRDTLLMRL